MARMETETVLKALLLNRYELLNAEKAEIEEELRGLQRYLKAIGKIKPVRGRKKKVEKTAEKPQRTVREVKASEREKKTEVPEPRKKTATNWILSLIGRAQKGISIDQIMKQTGLKRITINGVLNRMKKAGKVKAVGRGVYMKA